MIKALRTPSIAELIYELAIKLNKENVMYKLGIKYIGKYTIMLDFVGF